MLIRSFRQLVWLAALCLIAPVGVNAETGAGRTPVSRKQVADAMRSAGMETQADQVQVLANVTTTPGATLRVARKVKESPNAVLAELVCREPGQCLPFYALIHSNAAATAAAKSTGSSPSPTFSRSEVKAHPLVVRGQPVTLIIENADFRIELSAICLEAGLHGQTIRVASPDRKRFYSAEVVSNKIVRSTL
ncbi:MAG: flagella basal body P-ring formation protein FlgA [Terriglobales bacterium]